MLWFIIFIGLTSCVSKQPWLAHQMSVKPDYSCFTGPAEAGCDFYVWSCLNNEKIVVYQCGTALLMPQATKEVSACDSNTAFEKKYNITAESLSSCSKAKRVWQ